MKQFIYGVLCLLICIVVFHQKVYSDETNRMAYEAAYATYQLDLSARLLNHAIESYKTNPHGAGAIISAFDQMTNALVQADLIVGEFLDKQYPESHPYYAGTLQIKESLKLLVQSVTLLQTVSRGAASTGLSSYNQVEKIQDIISQSGAKACAATIDSNLEAKKISKSDRDSVTDFVIEEAQKAAMAAIRQKAGTSNVIANSDACMAAASAIAGIATYAQGAIALASMHQDTPFGTAFSSSFPKVIANNNKYLKFDEQQEIYATAFGPIFATTFSAVINQAALEPFFKPLNTETEQTNAETLIKGIEALSPKISQFLMPDATNIADVVNYRSILNSGFVSGQKLELQDLIFALQKLSGM